MIVYVEQIVACTLSFVCKITVYWLSEISLAVGQIRNGNNFLDSAIFRIYSNFFTFFLLFFSQISFCNRSLQRSHVECFLLISSMSVTFSSNYSAQELFVLLERNSHDTIFDVITCNFNRLVVGNINSFGRDVRRLDAIE
ncbi:unknown [Bacteroides sp. CAG:598]|nr:unknown [Bacteroides sp. CAG:598]